MLLRPFLRLYRNRLIAAAFLTVLFFALIHVWVSADEVLHLGVLWHSFCGCTPVPRDAFTLLSSINFVAIFLGGGLSFGIALNRPGIPSTHRLLFSRPISRLGIQLYPLGIAFAAIALYPAMGFAVLLGWLHLVHAPSLGHLLAIAELIPSAAGLGPHASLSQLLVALHPGRRYLAALVVGLSTYALVSAFRWAGSSSNETVRRIASLPFLFILIPRVLPKSWNLATPFLLVMPKDDLSYLPSNLAIGLHILFIAIMVLLIQSFIRQTEL